MFDVAMCSIVRVVSGTRHDVVMQACFTGQKWIEPRKNSFYQPELIVMSGVQHIGEAQSQR